MKVGRGRGGGRGGGGGEGGEGEGQSGICAVMSFDVSCVKLWFVVQWIHS